MHKFDLAPFLKFGVSAFLATLSPLILFAQEHDPIELLEEQTDKWIEIESKIATTNKSWKEERSLIETNIRLLESESKTLDAALKSNEKANALYQANQDSIASALAENEKGLESLRDPFADLSIKVRTLFPQLPEPLQKELQKHMAKLPAPDNSSPESSLSSQAQNLVAILTSIDRFNNSLTEARHTVESPSGGEVSVRALYWGLSTAYAIDEVNRRAWSIDPNGTEWRWNQNDEIYEKVVDLFTAYNGDETTPEMLLLPLTIN